MGLENFGGSFLEAYRKIIPRTMLHSEEISKERLRDVSLRPLSFYTADGIIYYLSQGRPMLALTRMEENLVLKHMDRACGKMAQDKEYFPPAEEVYNSLASPSTVSIDLKKLRLESRGEHAVLSFTPRSFSRLHVEEKKLVERVYGSGDSLSQILELFHTYEFERISLSVLDPSYVAWRTKRAALARVCLLGSFSNESCFSAHFRDVQNSFPLRAVRKLYVV